MSCQGKRRHRSGHRRKPPTFDDPSKEQPLEKRVKMEEEEESIAAPPPHSSSTEAELRQELATASSTIDALAAECSSLRTALDDMRMKAEEGAVRERDLARENAALKKQLDEVRREASNAGVKVEPDENGKDTTVREVKQEVEEGAEDDDGMTSEHDGADGAAAAAAVAADAAGEGEGGGAEHGGRTREQALRAASRPPRCDGYTVLIQGAPHDVSTREMKEFFAPLAVVSVLVGITPDCGVSGAYVVRFKSRRHARRAVQKSRRLLRDRYIRAHVMFQRTEWSRKLRQALFAPNDLDDK